MLIDNACILNYLKLETTSSQKTSFQTHKFCVSDSLKPPVARKLAFRHTNFVCLTASFLATGGFVKLFHKISMTSQWLFSWFSNSMIFPCMELFGWFSWFSMISRAGGNPVSITVKKVEFPKFEVLGTRELISKYRLSVSHEPFSLFHYGVLIWLGCFPMMIHCIS